MFHILFMVAGVGLRDLTISKIRSMVQTVRINRYTEILLNRQWVNCVCVCLYGPTMYSIILWSGTPTLY